jgi:hypothetical protein
MTSGGACRVELLGSAWLLAGQREVVIDLAGPTPLRDLIARLADDWPALVGPVIDAGRQRLADGSIVNRNGRDFLSSPDAVIQPGDHLLLVVGIGGGGGKR